MSEPPGTRAQILDLAQQLVQERGYHAVSYKDIGERLGIRNASIHYHFPGKTDLGVALVQRYRERLARTLDALNALSPALRLERYVAAYRDVVHADGRICLCTVLAAEDAALPGPIRAEVRAFLNLNEAWLARVLGEGRQAGELHFPGTPDEAASTFFATLEGAMLLARSSREAARFERIVYRSVRALRAA